MAKQVVLRQFPHVEGDAQVELPVRQLTHSKVFTSGCMVVMGDKPYTDWNELLRDIQSAETETVEVLQVKPVIGG